MTRLIDADAYLRKVCAYNETGCGSCKLQIICPANEPTVDAVPVRHGKWRKYYTEPPFFLRCSECGYSSQIASNYCPDCGAKMDKE